MPESFDNPCFCVPAPGTQAPGLAPYVISLNSLYGIVGIAPDGGVSVRTEGNTIFIGANGSAGLGTVTSANATSSNSNLVVTGGPITTTGTFQFSLAGNIGSISGLTMAADQMLYSTGPGVFIATPLTAFGRSLIDDAAAVNARSTLGLVIGTNVQAWNAELDSFISVASFSGSDITFSGDISGVDLTGSGDLTISGLANITGDLSANNGNFGATVLATSFSGAGGNITGLNGTNISTGTVSVNVGGTGIVSYTAGDLLYASGATTISKLSDVAVGRYLRSGGVGTAPLWSTLTLPNTSVVGDLLFCASANVITSLADVATGNALISGGVGVVPAWGKITSSHVNNTIATVAGGANSNITQFDGQITFTDDVFINDLISLFGEVHDASDFAGNAGDILTSTGTGTQWTTQIIVDTIGINTTLSAEGTITAGGSTGNKTINQTCGTVRIAASGTSVIVTNSLCTTSSRVLATCSNNDATAIVKNVVTTTGSFTINIVAATGEVEISWFLFNIT